MASIRKRDLVPMAKAEQHIATIPPPQVQAELKRLLGDRGVGLEFGEDVQQRPIIRLEIGGYRSAFSIESARGLFDDFLVSCLAEYRAGTLGTNQGVQSREY